jgi:hypothetical protein
VDIKGGGREGKEGDRRRGEREMSKKHAPRSSIQK